MVNANVLYLLYTNFSFYIVALPVSCALYNSIIYIVPGWMEEYQLLKS